MIKNEDIKKFISGDFGKATIMGKVSKGKPVLKLKLEGQPEDVFEYSDVDKDFNFENIGIDLFSCLISNYLNNNILNSTYYHVVNGKNGEIFHFNINGSRELNIALDKEFYSMLSNDFYLEFDRKRRNDILIYMKDLSIQLIYINNLDCFNLNSSSCFSTYDDYFIYDALAFENSDGKKVIPNEEKEFVYDIFDYYIKKEEIDLNYFYKIKSLIDKLLLGIDINDEKDMLKEISLNSKTSLSVTNIQTLILFKSFLDKYLSKYEKEKIEKGEMNNGKKH